MPHRKSREWILLADRAHAKIYTRNYVDGAMQQYLDMEHPAARMHQQALGTDRPGRTHGADPHRHQSYMDHADFPEQESKAFLTEVAQEINYAAAQDALDKLILVALPKTMAVIKSALNERTLTKVSGEYSKNLVGIPEHMLAGHLNEK